MTLLVGCVRVGRARARVNARMQMGARGQASASSVCKKKKKT